MIYFIIFIISIEHLSLLSINKNIFNLIFKYLNFEERMNLSLFNKRIAKNTKMDLTKYKVISFLYYYQHQSGCNLYYLEKSFYEMICYRFQIDEVALLEALKVYFFFKFQNNPERYNSIIDIKKLNDFSKYYPKISNWFKEESKKFSDFKCNGKQMITLECEIESTDDLSQLIEALIKDESNISSLYQIPLMI